ncbi:MAG: bifunctional hydroxymethylpyrimidine kinase/phosphomethylpyrimidine kinase [Neisseria sp.]|nr:bifunctional hydroxymethylpyrimidine kinase/phosphomethylpyrimidine kinase [Neisseria sp.]
MRPSEYQGIAAFVQAQSRRNLTGNLPAVRVLTIAGSDSGGGAGIQADLKTFAALGAYGASVISAVTAQNTQGVQAVYPLPPEIIRAQAEAVLSDIRIDAVKIGMLPDAQTAQAVAAVLRRYTPPFVVLDPVLRASSGDDLSGGALAVLQNELLPLADMVTPNTAELACLCGGSEAQNEAELWAQGRKLQTRFGAKNVLLKGGHFDDGSEACDRLLFSDGNIAHYRLPRLNTPNTHGTGCTLASAIAALFPQTPSLSEAVRLAKEYVHGAMLHAADWRLGKENGNGALAHFGLHQAV